MLGARAVGPVPQAEAHAQVVVTHERAEAEVVLERLFSHARRQVDDVRVGELVVAAVDGDEHLVGPLGAHVYEPHVGAVDGRDVLRLGLHHVDREEVLALVAF